MWVKALLWIQVLLLVHFLQTEAQPGGGGLRGGGSRGGRGGRGNRNRPKDLESDDKSGKLFHALSILYPLDIFNVDHPRDWRSAAVYDKTLADQSANDKPYMEWSRAQDQEDVWLYENWFYGMKDGIIIESGALDGYLFSTSYMYENYGNWSALHVEADPVNYSKLKVNRPNAVNVNGALCSESKLLHYSSLGVLPVRGFIEFMSPSFIKKWHGKIYNNKTSIDELPTVQCLPMKLLLRELNVKHVDIWILDVEGAEESVLKGTDFSTVRFNAVAMECDEHDVSKNRRKTDILEANGFECHLIERNCMCKNKEYTASSAPSKSALRKWDGQKWSQVYTPEEKPAV